MKKAVIFVVLALLFPWSGFALDRIPAEANVIIHIGSVQKLKLKQFTEELPKARQKIDTFLGAIEDHFDGFNPLEDITEVWLLVKQGRRKPQNRACVVARANLTGQQFSDALENLDKDVPTQKIASFTVYELKDGKSYLSFPEKGFVVIGQKEMVEAYLSCKSGMGENLLDNDAFNTLHGKLNDKAYVQLVAYNPDRMKAAMDKGSKRRRRRRGPMGDIIHNHLVGDVEPHGAVVQVFDSGLEAELFYSRSKKMHSIRAFLEISDPEIRISKIIDLIIDNAAKVEK